MPKITTTGEGPEYATQRRPRSKSVQVDRSHVQFRRNLNAARLDAGMSIPDVAAAVLEERPEMASSTVYRWFSSSPRSPQAAYFPVLARALGCPLNDLFRGV